MRQSEYFRLRERGFTASEAWRYAGIAVEFMLASEAGLVSLSHVPETEPHDDSYVETWGLSEKRTERAKKNIRETIEREGLWIISSHRKCLCCENWIRVDSIGDCIGTDQDDPYVFDLMRAALESLKSATH